MFSNKDQEQIISYGLNLEQINEQVKRFKNGFTKVQLNAPALLTSGIRKLNDAEKQKYISIASNLKEKKIIKFVPASGAASRMFKKLFEYLNSDKIEVPNEQVTLFFNNLQNFAFYVDFLAFCKKNNINFPDISLENYKIILQLILTDKGLGLKNLPKALMPFHHYNSGLIKTPLEEQVVEYSKLFNKKETLTIHFTISPKFSDLFATHFKKISSNFKNEYNLEIQTSFQNKNTDTTVFTLNNEPFRDEKGSLLFRPSGHGALLENLNNLDADYIFIKNIDNVMIEHEMEKHIIYKKILLGLLIEIQQQVFDWIQILQNEEIDENTLIQVNDFIQNNLGTYSSQYLKQEECLKILNRPIRVCGVVKNQGNVGGGPFWVSIHHNLKQLQIVESSQIDLNDQEQNQIFQESTHFNPVDIVCAKKDYKGQNFDLFKFKDADAGIITKKSLNGVDIKVLELPGLWNGSMAFWNTCFVEVPIESFNPVKEVNDLLKPKHLN